MQKLLISILFACLLPAGLYADDLTEAQALFEAGKYQQANNRLSSVLKQDPDNAQARFLKGLVLVELNDQPGAVEVFTAMTRDYPELPEPYNNIAVIHAANGDYDRARMALQSALKTHPSYATAYENLGDIYAKMASEAYQQALDLEKADRGKLKVKLSLIDNLFVDEVQAPLTPGPERVAATRVASQPERVKQATGSAKPKTPNVASASPPKAASKQASADQVNLLMDSIKAWAKAWSDQDVAGYLSYYAENFQPVKGSVAKWRSQRKLRLSKPKYIRIGLSDIKLVRMDAGSARVELVQTYESDSYSDVTRKRFDLVSSGGKWKITREIGI